MKYNELLNRLQNLINYTPEQSELCEIIDVKQSTMSNRANRNSNFKSDEIVKLNEHYNIDLYKNIKNQTLAERLASGNAHYNNVAFAAKLPPDIIEIPYWENLPQDLKIPDFPVTAPREVIRNHWFLDPDSLRIVSMVGDKMTNYWYKINENDILIIDTSHNFIRGNGVYFATSRNNTRFWVREMQALINDDIQIKGFAPSGETVKIFTPQQLEEVDFKIVGKVIKNVSFRL